MIFAVSYIVMCRISADIFQAIGMNFCNIYKKYLEHRFTPLQIQLKIQQADSRKK